MRARVGIIIFLAVFVLCRVTPASSELLQVDTQSAGSLSLTPEWGVVSKDELPERNLISDWVLNVQQVLYARAEHSSADPDAVLQIFAIWGADRDGNEKPLPEDILKTCENFVARLIGERYGNVSELGENIVETALENLSVATYEAEFSPENEGRTGPRYKCTSLYRGEKLVLVMLKYKPEFEGYWHGQLETLLNTWVGSLALTPTPAPAMAALEASLPLLPLPPPPPPVIPGPDKPLEETLLPAQQAEEIQQKQSQPEEREQPSIERHAPAPEPEQFSLAYLSEIPVVWIVSLPAVAFYVVGTLVAGRRLQKKGTPVEADPVGAEPVVTAAENPSEPETDVYPQARVLPTLEEWLAEKPLFERTDSHVPPSFAEGDGFNMVYSLLEQALSIVEDTEPTKASAPPADLEE